MVIIGTMIMMTTPWTTWVLDMQWHIWQSPKPKTSCLFGHCPFGSMGYKHFHGLVGVLFCPFSTRLIQGDQRDRVQDLQPPLAFSPHWTAMATSLWVFLNNNDSNLIITFHNNYDPLPKITIFDIMIALTQGSLHSNQSSLSSAGSSGRGVTPTGALL